MCFTAKYFEEDETKSDEMRRALAGTGEIGDAYSILIGKPGRTRPLWNHRCLWGGSIKTDHECDLETCSTFFFLLTGSSIGLL
jgi:hypothetical protein